MHTTKPNLPRAYSLYIDMHEGGPKNLPRPLRK